MHRFLDVCLSVQQDRDLAASLHSGLPLPSPELPVADAEEVLSFGTTSDETEEQALARAMAEERAIQETDA